MSAPPTRRERLRQQALDEIKQHALEQVGDGGSAALSLNAIAKAMGMSGPAIYRYYASREELLGALVTDGYGELARVVQDAAAASARRTPARRLAQVVEAYRAWALANPHRYGLLFSVRPEGYADPGEAIAAIEPGMQVLLELIGAIAGEGAGRDADAGGDPGAGGEAGSGADAGGGGDAGASGEAAGGDAGTGPKANGEAVSERRTTAGARLDADLLRWASTRGEDVSDGDPEQAEDSEGDVEQVEDSDGDADRPEARDEGARPAAPDEPALPPVAVLRLGVLIWTRMHGIIMLELAGIVGDMGLDGGLLVEAELETIAAAAAG